MTSTSISKKAASPWRKITVEGGGIRLQEAGNRAGIARGRPSALTDTRSRQHQRNEKRRQHEQPIDQGILNNDIVLPEHHCNMIELQIKSSSSNSFESLRSYQCSGSSA